MRLNLTLGLALVCSLGVTLLSLTDRSGEFNQRSQEILSQVDRTQSLILSSEKLELLELNRITQNSSGASLKVKKEIQDLIEKEKQNFYIKNKMLRIEKIHYDGQGTAQEEDQLYDAVSHSWKEYAGQFQSEPALTRITQVKASLKNLHAYYYSEMNSIFTTIGEKDQSRNLTLYLGLMVQTLLLGFLFYSLKKMGLGSTLKKQAKTRHYTLIPIPSPKSSVKGDSSNGSSSDSSGGSQAA